jgi:hypothetical protein
MDGNAALDSNRSLERLESVIARSEAAVVALLEETLVLAARCESDEGYEPPADRAGRSSPARLARLADRLTRARTAKDRLYQRALPSPGQDTQKVAAAERMVGRAEQAVSEAVAAAHARFEAHARRTLAARAAGLHGTAGRPPVAVERKDKVVRQRARLARTVAWLEIVRNPRPIPSRTARASLTDPDSRLLPGKHGGFLQGYNLQISCARNQVLLAVELHDNPSDMAALVPMVKRSSDNCAQAGMTQQVQAWLADNGYASTANFETLALLPLLVAVTGGKPTDPVEPGPTRPVPPGWTHIADQLTTPEGQKLYRRRAALIEPGFAQLFQRFGRHLNQRGAHGVGTEIKLLGTVHNLSKLFTHGTQTASLARA